MWVAGSQKPMQSAKLLPPPPGVLGAASLPGVKASEPRRAGPPPEVAGGWVCGESGDTCCCSGAGWFEAEGGRVVGCPPGLVCCEPPGAFAPGVGPGAGVLPGVVPGVVPVLGFARGELLGAACGARPAGGAARDAGAEEPERDEPAPAPEPEPDCA